MKLIRTLQFVTGILGVFALAWASVAFTRHTGTVAAVWPADAVALCLALRWAKHTPDRIAVVLGAVLVEALSDILNGSTPIFGLALSACNGVGLAVGISLLRKLEAPFDSPGGFARFLLGGVVLGPLAGAIPAALAFKFFVHDADVLRVMLRWFMGVALGVALIAPAVLRKGRPWSLGRFDRQRVLAAVGAQAAFTAVAALILLQDRYAPLSVLFPFLVLAVLADKDFGAVIAVITTTLLAVAGMVMGRGVVVIAHASGVETIQVVQLLIGCMLLTAHPIAAMVKKLDLLAAENERRRAEAEELSSIKTKLLAHVSHEIRSPLSGVTSMAELMSEGIMGELTAQQRETLLQIARAGAEVQALSRDLLDAATLQSGAATVNILDVSVEEAVEAAVTAARFRGREYDGSVAVVSAYLGGVKVAADPLRLRQILVNLIVNGLKYGGRPAMVQVCAFATDKGTVRFEISDNGAGVDPILRDTLFKSFSRLGAEKSDIEGAGLGLALSRELALLQNGRLCVDESDLGGAKFWLELPLWRQGEEAAAA